MPQLAERKHYSRPDLAAQGVTLSLAVMAAAYFLQPFGAPRPLHEKFLSEHITMLQMVDNSTLSRAYTIGLLALAGWAMLASLLYRHITVLAPATFIRRNAGFIAAAGVVALLAAGVLSPSLLAGSIGLVASAALLRKFVPLKWQWIGGSGLLLAYIVTLSLWGLLHIPYIPDWLLSITQWHYSATLAQGDRLAEGLALGRDVQLHYGLGPTLPLGIYEKIFGLLDFAGHIRLVQFSQIAYLLLSVVALFLWKRNLWFVLFGTLLTGPFAGTMNSATLSANQAGWRSLGFPIVVIAFVLMRAWPMRRRALALGFLAGGLLLYNPETGIALALACAGFALAQHREWRADFKVLGCALAGALAAGALTLVCYRLGLGAWPAWESQSFLLLLSRFGGGYGGLPIQFDALASLLFVHSAFVGVLLFLKWRQRGLDFADAVRFAMSIAILAWLPYYVNRPAEWNLWTFLLPYCILIAHWFEPRYFRRSRFSAWRGAKGARLAVLCGLVLPLALGGNLREIPIYLAAFGERPPGIEVSGVLVAPTTAFDLQTRAGFLERQDKSTLFFSHHSYILSLMTGRFNKLPVQDAFAETTTTREFDALVQTIRASPAQRLLFDEEESNESYAAFYQRLKSRLAADFVRRADEGNWQIWERR